MDKETLLACMANLSDYLWWAHRQRKAGQPVDPILEQDAEWMLKRFAAMLDQPALPLPIHYN